MIESKYLASFENDTSSCIDLRAPLAIRTRLDTVTTGAALESTSPVRELFPEAYEGEHFFDSPPYRSSSRGPVVCGLRSRTPLRESPRSSLGLATSRLALFPQAPPQATSEDVEKRNWETSFLFSPSPSLSPSQTTDEPIGTPPSSAPGHSPSPSSPSACADIVQSIFTTMQDILDFSCDFYTTEPVREQQLIARTIHLLSEGYEPEQEIFPSTLLVVQKWFNILGQLGDIVDDVEGLQWKRRRSEVSSDCWWKT